MELVLDTELVKLWKGDCREVMATLPDCSVDAIVTDPPYELGFMGKGWDSSGIAFDQEVWAQAFRVLKPGGHALVFGGTRTWHRVAVAVEDAGFEIRDSMAWLYGSGFPKSMDVSRAIDKAARGVPQGGADPTSANHGKYRTTKTEGKRWNSDSGQGYGAGGSRFLADGQESYSAMAPVGSGAARTAPEADTWQGWGTALKPAFEPIVVARKPLEGTVAANVLAHGTGALNIDASRIGTQDNLNRPHGATAFGIINDDSWKPDAMLSDTASSGGRFPSNVILDESQAAALDEQTGTLTSGLMKARTERKPRPGGQIYGADKRNIVAGDTYADSGGASRFFYVAKAGSAERPTIDGEGHSTVKPLTLMRYLARLVTPPGGKILEMFAGSGTTLEAALLEGFEVIGIELDEDGKHIPLILQRLEKPMTPAMF